jgi:hypothetical protein
MAGISFKTGIGTFRPGGQSVSSGGAPATAAQAAFGPGATQSPQSAGNALTPNDPASIALWGGIAGVALLVFLRCSLPG